MFKGIIFDLDGTTIQTIKDLTNAVNYIRNEYSFSSLSEDEVQRCVGRGMRLLVKDTLPIENTEKAYQEFLAYYAIHYQDYSYAYEGMNKLLTTLQDNGIIIACNSNKAQAQTEGLLKKLYPDINFIKVCGQREGIPTKPDPYGANEIIETMKLDRKDICFCGDSKIDIETGKNAGLKTIGVSWGFREVQTLIDAKADYIAKKPEDILKIVLKG